MSYISVKEIRHAYQSREALRGVSFDVEQGEIFGFLGPNGSGKTTLFRILATVFPATSGEAFVDGFSLTTDYRSAREKMGVVFQAPGLDSKLTVEENLKYHALLFGYKGRELRSRCDQMLEQVALSDRRRDLVGSLSGGLKRRVELAKGLLNKPGFLLLDEPSTGLDPGARIDLWNYLKQIQSREKVTIMVTTHLMEEAEHCDRIAILNEGLLVKVDTPQNLKAGLSKDILIVKAAEPERFADEVREKFSVEVSVLEEGVMIEHSEGARFVTTLVENFTGRIESVTFRKPTLEDVFVHHTGHRFWSSEKAHA